jgi:hypothetical protein
MKYIFSEISRVLTNFYPFTANMSKRGGRKRQRTASRASSVQSSTPASSLAPTEPIKAMDKKSKFERRFKTDTTSDEDVLGMCCYLQGEYTVNPSFG